MSTACTVPGVRSVTTRRDAARAGVLACWPFAEPAWLGRLRSAWRQARQRSCERALHRALVHSLQGLGPGTLRDLGLADQVPPLPALPHSLLLMNYERSLW